MTNLDITTIAKLIDRPERLNPEDQKLLLDAWLKFYNEVK